MVVNIGIWIDFDIVDNVMLMVLVGMVMKGGINVVGMWLWFYMLIDGLMNL